MHIALHAEAGSNTETQVGVSPKLVNAAHEFEAQLMKELMKPLTKATAPGDEGDDSDNNEDSFGSESALGEFASEAMARALSNSGGFGIADKIVSQLSQREASEGSHSGNHEEGMREIGKEHDKTRIKLLK